MKFKGEKKKSYTWNEVLDMLNKKAFRIGDRTILISTKQAATGCIYEFKELSSVRIKEYEPFEIYEPEKAFVKKKTYKGWEILKMLEEETLKSKQKFYLYCNDVKQTFKEKEVIITWNGLQFVDNEGEILTLLDILNHKFEIKNNQEYMTFEEARKLGIPKHKDYGYNLPGTFNGMHEFIKEMDRKEWEVEQN